MPPLSLKVNGQIHNVDVDPETPLLYVLSDDLLLRGQICLRPRAMRSMHRHYPGPRRTLLRNGYFLFFFQSML